MDLPADALDVLVIAPHPDDAELGMGGSIVKLLTQGYRVGVLDLTDGEPTPHGTVERRVRETAQATSILKLTWRGNLGLSNRRLEATLEARTQLANAIRLTRPAWLFAPYWVDAHPDHVAATQLVEAARFWAKLTKSDLAGEPHFPARIYNYFCVHLRIVPQPTFVIDISDEFETKLRSIRSYESQFVHGRSSEPPTFLDRIRDEAAFWGKSIGARFGEPFAARETLGLSDFRSLI
jgi:bacillithiol biosynthesis deacetylase BshB1